MKRSTLFAALHFLLLQFLFHQTAADLSSDKQALLNFAAAVPHGRRLNWKSATDICSAWEGITCNPNGSRVLTLRLPGRGLFGPVPANTIDKLDALTILSFPSNFLTGNLPSDILSLPSLRYIYLQRNNFSGAIPSTLSPNLRWLDLSFNFLTGNIPAPIQNLTLLVGLSLQNNFLNGSIPDLNLPNLNHLNLSNNKNLHGQIPFSLQKFSISSFEGNFKLCGSPLNQCSSVTPSPSPSHNLSVSPISAQKEKQRKWEKLHKRAIIATAVGGFALVFILLFVTSFFCLKKRNSEKGGGEFGKVEKPNPEFGIDVQESENNKLVFFRGSSNNFDLEDLLRASAEVLGKGSYGTTYKAILEEGTTVVVKRLKEVVVGKRDFDQQMENIGRIGQHPNIVPLRAYYYSKDEKLLVYDYISNGSLSTLLHANRDNGRTLLTWETRKKICHGSAMGIAYIHSARPGKLIHGNVRSSNVLLTKDFDGLVSDFGLTPLINFQGLPSKNTGYRAPEVIETKKLTQMSDVYSFGILLLELLTGKAPVRSHGHDEEVVDLPRWVRSVVREEWTAEVFDVDLLKCSGFEEEEMVQLLQIAMNCVATMPDDRPKMEEIVEMIEEIQPPGSDNRPI